MPVIAMTVNDPCGACVCVLEALRADPRFPDVSNTRACEGLLATTWLHHDSCVCVGVRCRNRETELG